MEEENTMVHGGRGTRKSFNITSVILLIIACIAVGIAVGSYLPKRGGEGFALDDQEDQDCSVVGLNVHGGIDTYLPLVSESTDPIDGVSSEDLVFNIKAAQEDDDIKGLILEVDSGGGSSVAGEEVANALREFTKPSVVVIRQIGASAAYWLSTGADHIIASKNSDIGSIGVTASYILNTDSNKQYVGLTSGKYKDTGSPDKPLSEDERTLITRDLDIIHKNFIEAVAKNRNIPIEKVTSIADGSTVLGAKALELGLIDEIGSWSEAEAYLESQIGEKPSICWR